MRQNGSVRPALEALIDRQKAAVDSLTEGFGSNEEIVLWCHESSVLSAGLVDEQVLRGFPFGEQDKAVTEGLVGELAGGDGRQFRERLAVEYILPPFGKAVRELRWSFTEYGEDPPAVSEQRDVAMRPVVQELWDRQREMLLSFLDGFGSRSELIDWGQDLHKATLGVHDDDFVRRLAYEPASWDLVSAGEVGGIGREKVLIGRQGLASYYLLPWFNEAIRQQAPRASEQAGDVEADLSEYELGEELLGEDTGDGGG